MTTPTMPSDTVLDEAPARALKFLQAVGNNSYIRAALAKRGYTQADHDRGWDVLLKASGYRQPIAISPPDDRDAAAALAELDAWDEPNFRVARAALASHPEQLAFVFDGLVAATGAGAIISVTLFLDRLDALENGKDRKAIRKADRAAVEKLASRGFTKAERERLRALLAIAKRGGVEPRAAASLPDPAALMAEQRVAKRELQAFFAEWSEVARADIKRRDHLILLGLARRKVGKKAGEAPAGADATADASA